MNINNDYRIQLVNPDAHPSQMTPHIVYEPYEFNECKSKHNTICGVIPDSKNMIHLNKIGNIQVAKYMNDKINTINYTWSRVPKLINPYFDCD